jgi:predicted phosphate transport protein (TIGR00153 family)
MLFKSRAARDHEAQLLGLFVEAGANAERSAQLLRDLIADYPERADLARELFLCEQEGDRIAHDIIHGLDGGGPRPPRLPFEADDGHRLATTVDDIVDFAEQAADQLGLYQVEAPMEQANKLAEVLVGSARQVALALRALADGTDLTPYLVEIHRLENDGDRISRDAIASLFQTGIDPMVVIRWKDIFEVLEAAIDSCETVAHVLEGIAIKRRRN